MKLIPNNPNLQGKRAFTLIEMIGVLAVIAILAALLIPKVFQAINDARINNAVVSIETVKTAAADHYGKYGSFAVDGTTNPPASLGLPISQYDMIPLMKESLMDKPFQIKVGDQIFDATHTHVEAVDISPTTGLNLTQGASVDGTASTGFALAGGTTNMVVGSIMLRAVITGVAAGDAKDVNDRIDGQVLGSAINVQDFSGRVKYATPGANGTTVYVYITHR